MASNEYNEFKGEFKVDKQEKYYYFESSEYVKAVKKFTNKSEKKYLKKLKNILKTKLIKI